MPKVCRRALLSRGQVCARLALTVLGRPQHLHFDSAAKLAIKAGDCSNVTFALPAHDRSIVPAWLRRHKLLLHPCWDMDGALAVLWQVVVRSSGSTSVQTQPYRLDPRTVVSSGQRGGQVAGARSMRSTAQPGVRAC